jgi:thioredoxin 1
MNNEKLKRYLLIVVLVVSFGLLTYCSGDSNDIVNSKSNNINNKAGMEHLTKETFKEKVFNYEKNAEWKYEGDLPCIIDFYADWCGPCKMIAPVLEELAKEYDGKIKIYKVNTEEEQELAGMFGIKSIPSILFCPKSGQPQMAMGALPKQSFVNAINDVLLKGN